MRAQLAGLEGAAGRRAGMKRGGEGPARLSGFVWTPCAKLGWRCPPDAFCAWAGGQAGRRAGGRQARVFPERPTSKAKTEPEPCWPEGASLPALPFALDWQQGRRGAGAQERRSAGAREQGRGRRLCARVPVPLCPVLPPAFLPCRLAPACADERESSRQAAGRRQRQEAEAGGRQAAGRRQRQGGRRQARGGQAGRRKGANARPVGRQLAVRPCAR